MAPIDMPARLTSRLLRLVRLHRVMITTLALLLSTTALVSASIPNSQTGLISGCYAKDGTGLRFIDAQAGAVCKKGETAISWNQTGPQGIKGDPGPSGVPGERGPAGVATLASLQDTPCTRYGGGTGYVDITIDAANAIVFTCAPGIPHWCDTHTPSVGPHLNVTCDEIADSLSFVCDVGWVNFDGDIANGCEVEGFEPSHAAIQAFAENFVLGAHDITIAPNCSDPNATIYIGCVGGQPVDPLPTAHIVGSNLVIQDLGPDEFGISLDLAITTPTGVPVSGSGLDCTVTVDTSPGTYATSTIAGQLAFLVNAQTGITDEMQTSQVALNQFESADVVISGGFGCDLANALKGFFLNTLKSQLESYLDITVCRAPDPEIFVICPAP